MRDFTSAELTRMRSTQDAAMQDTCQVLVYSSAADGYGNPSPTYTAGDAIACGLELVSPSEKQASGDVPVIDARLRLPIDTTIDERNRIQVTHRYGEELDTAQIFEIEGPVKRGPSGLVLDLRLSDD